MVYIDKEEINNLYWSFSIFDKKCIKKILKGARAQKLGWKVLIFNDLGKSVLAKKCDIK